MKSIVVMYNVISPYYARLTLNSECARNSESPKTSLHKRSYVTKLHEPYWLIVIDRQR